MKSIVVYDLEANHHQATKNYRRRINKLNKLNPENPKEERKLNYEVIEIGAVKLELQDNKWQIVDSFHELVKPVHINLNPYILNLTGIQSEQLDNADLLVDVLPRFKDFVGESLLVSWGTWDKVLLYSSCDLIGIEKTWFKDTHVNIQNQVSKILKADKGIQMGLKTVVEKLDIEIEGNSHSAIFDAKCAALVLIELHDQIDFSDCLSKSTKKRLNIV